MTASEIKQFLEIGYEKLEELNLEAKARVANRTATHELQEHYIRYLTDEKRIKAFGEATPDKQLKSVLEFVAIREGEHAMAFTKRMCELGCEVDEESAYQFFKDFDGLLACAASDASDAEKVAMLNGQAVRDVAECVAGESLAMMQDTAFVEGKITSLFQPKGAMDFDLWVIQSITGPIGLPASEAVYPPVQTEDGAPMNAKHDYEIVMSAENLPPTDAFWSTTLYDLEQGFFIPNDRFKYSVGENAGFKLDEDGGIRIVIAAEQPEGVPEENWLPVNRGDYDIDLSMRIYAPDLERFAEWTPPIARKIN